MMYRKNPASPGPIWGLQRIREFKPRGYKLYQGNVETIVLSSGQVFIIFAILLSVVVLSLICLFFEFLWFKFINLKPQPTQVQITNDMYKPKFGIVNFESSTTKIEC